MKTLITILITVFSVNTFAQFNNFKKTFDSLLISNSDSSEFTLEYFSFNQDEDGYNETSPIIAYILNERFTDGLTSMKLQEVFDKKEALELFGSQSPYFGNDYYCYRLIDSYDYGVQQQKECIQKLEKILEAAFSEKDANSVSILSLEGDYYGDWETKFLILQDFDTNSSLIIEFDILHEI